VRISPPPQMSVPHTICTEETSEGHRLLSKCTLPHTSWELEIVMTVLATVCFREARRHTCYRREAVSKDRFTDPINYVANHLIMEENECVVKFENQGLVLQI